MNNLPKKHHYQKLLKTTSLFLVLSLAFIFSTYKAQAQNQTQSGGPITAAPARQEMTIKPGGKSAFVIKFFNQGDTSVSGPIKVADFIVEDSEGTPTFIEESVTISPKYAAASWVTLPYDRITIAAKDSVIIQATIQAPEDTQPGGRYLAIFFEPGGQLENEEDSTSNEAETPVSVRLAGLVYIRVAGPVEENAYVTQLTSPRFLEFGPIPVTTEILNRGNYHIKPKGTITLTSMFGKQIDQQLIDEKNIFPEVSRFYENKIGAEWMFGKYRIDLNASYGESGQILTATVFTWVFPWRLIATIMLAVIAIILLISVLYHRIKKRQQDLEEKIEQLEEKLEEKPSQE